MSELTVLVTYSTTICLPAAAARSAQVSKIMLIERSVIKRLGFVFIVALWLLMLFDSGFGVAEPANLPPMILFIVVNANRSRTFRSH
jgi:hypothetical protein